MNAVSLIGILAGDPELQENRASVAGCRMTLAVPRRSRDDRRYPGVVYVDATTFGDEAQDCAAMSAGTTVGWPDASATRAAS
jgi:single-stranded DNA-binding protein